jgi:hypothetical protein
MTHPIEGNSEHVNPREGVEVTDAEEARRKAFESLVDSLYAVQAQRAFRHYGRLYGPSVESALDHIHDALIRVHSRAGRIDDPVPWLFGVMRLSLLKSASRARRRESILRERFVLPPGVPEEESLPDPCVLSFPIASIVFQLPESMANIVSAHIVDDLPLKVVAASFGQKPSSLRKKWMKCRRSLRVLA